MLYLFILLNGLWMSQADDFVLYPGYRQTLELGPGAVTVEQRGVIDIRDNGRTLSVIGKKIGTTKLVSSKKTIDVHVLSQKNYRSYDKLRSWTKGKMGPQLKIEGGKAILSGKLLIFDDWQELKETMDLDDTYENRLRLDDSLETRIRKDMETVLQKHQLPFTDLVTNGPWKLYLGKKQKSDEPEYKKVLNPFGIQVASSPFVVSGVPMVEINIVAAEINKKHMSQIGVQWPGNTALQPFAEQLIAKESWSLTIDHLEQNGWGKVLASPTLVTQSGEEATFHSGGEMPIRTATQFNTNVFWKKYGIIMKIKPIVDFKGNIDVVIECEVSMIDGSTVVDGAPGLLINRITSHFNLQDNRTIALSGLIKEEWAKGRKGLPAVKDIPIFGYLFGSENYLNNRSELFFFVTPKIVH